MGDTRADGPSNLATTTRPEGSMGEDGGLLSDGIRKLMLVKDSSAFVIIRQALRPEPQA